MIPGIFFDVDPSHRRNLFNSPCHHFVRISFGPPLEDLDKGDYFTILLWCRVLTIPVCYLGLDAMERVIKRAKEEGMKVFGEGYVRPDGQ